MKFTHVTYSGGTKKVQEVGTLYTSNGCITKMPDNAVKRLVKNKSVNTAVQYLNDNLSSWGEKMKNNDWKKLRRKNIRATTLS